MIPVWFWKSGVYRLDLDPMFAVRCRGSGRWVNHDSICFCNLCSTVVEYCGVVILTSYCNHSHVYLSSKKTDETRPDPTHIIIL